MYLSCNVNMGLSGPPKMFDKEFYYKFRNIYRKTSVPEYLFDKAAGLKVYNFIKKILQHRCFPVDIAKYLIIAFL